jgi:exosortase A-associated hydrolase 2
LASAFFLPLQGGSRFCVHHAPPPGRERGRGVIYVHPFGDEMHKSRRMAALQSRRLAGEGYSVLQIDLHGCGDSSGEFVDARWESWSSDVRAAMQWLKQRVDGPLSLWGLRLGATLACDVARDRGLEIDQLLLWQPVVEGGQFLSQFLRTRLAGEMLAGGAATSALGELRKQLAEGRSLEIAGYELHPAMASAIERMALSATVPAARRVRWCELAAEPGLPLRPASRRVLDMWQARGLDVSGTSIAGEPFWATIEISECEELLAATTGAMEPPN